MSMPTVTVEAAFGVLPGVVPGAGDWVDLTDRVGYPGGITWGYGRSNERDQADAGVGTIIFDNSDRALDPTNTASPYWPNVRPMTRIRVQATHLTVTYPVLEGFVEAWPPQWRGTEWGWTVVPIVDGFKLLSMARTSVSYSSQQTGARVEALLTAAGWPATKRDIDTGQSDVQAYTASDRIVLNAIRDTAEAESGVFYINPSGNAIFRDRLRRILSDSQATFGDDGIELEYEDIQISFDDSNLWNDIAVKPEGLTVQRAVNQDSIDLYGHRHLPEFGALITSEFEASDAANWTLRRYKDPRLRVESLILRGDLFDGVMTQILALEVGSRITARGRPAGGGLLEREVFIEHVKHKIGATSWETTWRLSPAFSETVWLIGIVGSSEIGVSTWVGY